MNILEALKNRRNIIHTVAVDSAPPTIVDDSSVVNDVVING